MALEDAFPGLRHTGYGVTSPASPSYNCIAWAAGDTVHWWEPSGKDFWPAGAPADYTVLSLIRAFETQGFVVCTDSLVETGYEKIAIFGDGDEFTHAARQLGNGKWTSKLGAAEDIEHEDLRALEGVVYGAVLHVLKRPSPA